MKGMCSERKFNLPQDAALIEESSLIGKFLDWEALDGSKPSNFLLEDSLKL